MSDRRSYVLLGLCILGCEQAPATPSHTLGQPPPAAFVASLSAGIFASPQRVALSTSKPRVSTLNRTRPASLETQTHEATSACPDGMVRISDYCMDRYEAYVVEIDANGHEVPHSPYLPVDGQQVRAKVAKGVLPQGYISQIQAKTACENAGKRLCSAAEFSLACRGSGRAQSTYPYGGTRHQAGKCNEGKGSAVSVIFGSRANFGNTQLNDPRLNEWPGGLAKTGQYASSRSPFGVYDLVGNLHEWSAEVAPNGHGFFRGGFYGDAELNGSGCDYVTKAHSAGYHDYSTGFRCCRDVESDSPTP